MEFNFSQKTDPETKNLKIIIEGDNEFMESFKNTRSFFIHIFQDLIKQAIEIINLKKKQSSKPTHESEVIIGENSPLISVEGSHTIKVTETLADLIFEENTDIIDRLVLVKDSQGNVLALQIN